jgi:hypothetical protein
MQLENRRILRATWTVDHEQDLRAMLDSIEAQRLTESIMAELVQASRDVAELWSVPVPHYPLDLLRDRVSEPEPVERVNWRLEGF